MNPSSAGQRTKRNKKYNKNLRHDSCRHDRVQPTTMHARVAEGWGREIVETSGEDAERARGHKKKGEKNQEAHRGAKDGGGGGKEG